MTSRRASIIAIANTESRLEMDARSKSPEIVANLEAIRVICEQLVMKPHPCRPTAPLVAEIGAIRRVSFPGKQTLWNSYRKMLQLWRRAYVSILDIDAIGLGRDDDLDKIDVTKFDVGARGLIQDLIVRLKEMRRQRDGFAASLSKVVPTPAGSLPQNADQAVRKLKAWTEKMRSGVFDLDDIGLRVSRKTATRTVIMEADTFNELCTLLDDYIVMSKTRKSQAGN